MQIITHTTPRLLIADVGKKIKAKNDNGEVLEDGTIIEPHYSTLLFLGKQITTLEQCKELYEEIEVK